MFRVSHHIRVRPDDLNASLGRVTPAIDQTILENQFEKDDFAGMLGWIKYSMRLSDLRVGLRIVNGGDPKIPMWVDIPNPMPAYGSSEFYRCKIVVNARRGTLYSKPFEWIVAGFAHELAHVVLKSLNSKHQDDQKGSRSCSDDCLVTVIS